jgi:hypothetical protein
MLLSANPSKRQLSPKIAGKVLSHPAGAVPLRVNLMVYPCSGGRWMMQGAGAALGHPSNPADSVPRARTRSDEVRLWFECMVILRRSSGC